MESHTTVIVGAGQAGLAMSRVLSENGIDHVVLERGEVANSWRRDRWDSLRLLTPNWQSRLPGNSYQGSDPDGFMSAQQVVARLAGYATRYAMPVRAGTEVLAVRADIRRLSHRDEPGAVVVPPAGSRERRLCAGFGAGAGGGGSELGLQLHRA